MLKFFREYNKYILVVGVSVLMFIFLIEPTLTFFQSTAADQPLGRIRGKKLYMRDQQAANEQMEALNRIAPLLVRFTADDAFQWMLMVEEAKVLGLSASDYEVDFLLKAINIKSDEELAATAEKVRYSTGTIRTALRHWVMLQTYRELILGLAHLTIEERLNLYSDAVRAMEAGQYQSVEMALEASVGRPRLSEPLAERFLIDQIAGVKIDAVRIPADAATVETPDPAAVQVLFERYKDALPGTGEQYGMGYRTPQRVKLEYLSLPLSRLLAAVSVEESEIFEYYEANPSEFIPQNPGIPEAERKPMAYDVARTRIRSRLMDRKAMELGDRITRAAQAMLMQEIAGLPEDAGYRQIDESFRPIALSTVAERIQKQHGVLPDVTRLDDRWLDRDALAALQGLGESRTIPRGYFFTDYMLSTRELTPKAEDPVTALRLQRGVPSTPLIDAGGTRYIVRVLDAQPARSPASVDEVREQVEADARKLAAYEALVKSRADWEARVRAESLEAIAKALDVSVLSPPPFPRREFDLRAGLQVPTVQGVGRSEQFVDQVFELAQRVADAGTIDNVPEAQRVDAIPVDEDMSLYLVRLEAFEPPSKSDMMLLLSRPVIRTTVETGLLAEHTDKPFSVTALRERLGFVAAD